MPWRKVLIVEDHGPTRVALSRYFKGRGWDVEEAGTVGDALVLLDYGPEPTLLILDLILPDGDGGTVLRRVRAAGMRTFVVVASACEDRRLWREVTELGPNCILPKPYALEALCRACTVYLEEWAATAAGIPRALAADVAGAACR